MLTTYLDKPGYTWNSRALTLIPACGFLTAAGLAWLSTRAALGVDIEFPLPITGVSYRLQYQLSCQPGHSDHDAAIARAAEILNAGQKVAILVGSGATGPRGTAAGR